jgi:hypothetical protein
LPIVIRRGPALDRLGLARDRRAYRRDQRALCAGGGSRATLCSRLRFKCAKSPPQICVASVCLSSTFISATARLGDVAERELIRPRAQVRPVGQIHLVRWPCFFLAFRESARPATVSLNDVVDLPHQADGVSQGDDDLLVMGNVVVGEYAALAILEPLLVDLVPADVEVPDGFRHTVEPDGSRRGGLALLGRGGVEPYGVG